jgi:acetyl-CoA synthetase
MLRTIWGDDQRYVETYFGKFGGKYYLAGDSRAKMKTVISGSWDASMT